MLRFNENRSFTLAIMTVVTALGGVMYAYGMGLLPEIHFQQEDIIAWFAAEAKANPWVAYGLYFLFFTLVLCLSLPMVSASILAAGAVFSMWEAIILVTVCRMSAAWICFGLTRNLLPCAQRMLMKPWCRNIQRRIEREGVWYLFILRIMPLLPDSVVNYTMGLTPMRWVPYTLTSFVGMLPLTLLNVYLGAEINQWLETIPWDGIMPPLQALLMIGVALTLFFLSLRMVLRPAAKHVLIERRRPYAPYSYRF